MSYIDGFMCPVRPGKKQAYVDMATKAAELFIEYGALRVVEGWNDDIKPGKINDMRSAVLAEEGQDIIFSWIEWPDKATRDEGWGKLMQDERMQPPEDEAMVGPHMIYGGFTTLLDRRA